MKYWLYILFIFLSAECIAQVWSETPPVSWNNEYGADEWDNTFELIFSNVSASVGGYFECDIHICKKGDWYDYTSGTKPNKANRFVHRFSAFNIHLEFNEDIFDKTNGSEVTFTWGQFWIDAEGELQTELRNQSESGDWYYLINGYDLDYSEDLTLNTQVLLGHLKWKIKSGVTTGMTGIRFRVCDLIKRSSGALNSGNWKLWGIQTGNADINIGGDVPLAPVLAGVSGDDALCLTGTVDGNYSATLADGSAAATSYEWKVYTDAAGTIEASGYNLSAQITANCTVTWTTPGTFYLGVKAKNAGGDSDQKRIKVVVDQMPTGTLAITSSPGKLCAASEITFTATAGWTTYTWRKGSNNSTPLQSSTSNAYKETPGSGNFTYYVETEKGSCKATASKTITVNTAPEAILTKTALACGIGSGDNVSYVKSDIIQYVASGKKGAGDYTYAWSNSGTAGMPVITGSKSDTATVMGAVGGTYIFRLQVTDKNGCQSEWVSKTLTDAGQDANKVSLDLTSSSDKICNGGVNILTADASAGSLSISSYEWSKENVVLASGTDVNEYTTSEGGTYKVKVLSARCGYAEKEITINKVNQNPIASVSTPAELYVPSGHSTILPAFLTPETSTGTWLWKPAGDLTTAANIRNPKTKDIFQTTPYEVYYTDVNACMTKSSIKVIPEMNMWELDLLPENPTICAGGKVTLQAVVKNAPAGSTPTYAWTGITVSGNSSTALYWDNDATTGANVGDQEIMVVVTIDGKSQTALTTVKVLAQAAGTAPTLALSPGELCAGEEVKVSVTGHGNSMDPTSYQWFVTKADGTAGVSGTDYNIPSAGSLALLKGGAYTVQIQGKANTGNCLVDTTGTGIGVKVNEVDLQWQTEPQDYFTGQDVVASAKASMGTTPYVFSWSPAGGQKTDQTDVSTYKIANAKDDSYRFVAKVTDAKACQDSVVKIVNAKAGGLKLEADKSALLCGGGSAWLQAKVSGGTAPYTLIWYKATQTESSPIHNNNLSAAGTDSFMSNDFTNGEKVVVKVSDAGGLIMRDTVTVTVDDTKRAPAIEAQSSMTIAANTDVYLIGALKNPALVDVANLQWNWTGLFPGNATVSQLQNPQTAKLSTTQNYDLYVKDATSGCYSTTSALTITVDPSATKFDLAIDGITPLCLSGVSDLSAQVADGITLINYVWSTAGADNVAASASATAPTYKIEGKNVGQTTVYLKATNSLGISATATKVIDVKNATAPVIEFASDKRNLCLGDKIEVKGNGNLTYAWKTNGTTVSGNTGNSYQPTAAGTVSIGVLASNGTCWSATSLTDNFIVNANPVIDWTANTQTLTVVNPGDPVGVKAEITSATQGAYTWTWSHGDDSKSYSDANADTCYLNATATADAMVYKFAVSVKDANGCISNKLDKTVSLASDGIFFNIESTGDYCETGGGAVLNVKYITSSVDKSTITYTWYKGSVASSNQVATGEQLILAHADVNATYYVVATTSADAGITKQMSFTPQSKAGTAPTVTGITGLTVATGGKTALKATATGGTPSYSWNWAPASHIADGETTKEIPNTRPLSASQDFKAYVIDDAGCVGVGDVHVEVVNDPSQALEIEIIPSPVILCTGNTTKIELLVKGGGSETPTFAWTPIDGTPDSYLSAKNIANPVFTAPAFTGKFAYSVEVNKGALKTNVRVDVEVTSGANVAIDWLTQNTSLCTGNSVNIAVTSLNTPVPDGSYRWYVDGVLQAGKTSAKVDLGVMSEGTHKVTVVAQSSNHCISPELSKDFTFHNIDLLTDLKVVDSCGVDAKVQAVLGSGVTPTKYDWKVEKSTVTPTTLSGTDDLERTVVMSKSGNYTVSLTVTDASNGCVDSMAVDGKFIQVSPTIEFLIDTLCQPYIKELVMNQENPGNADAGVYTLNYVYTPWGQTQVKKSVNFTLPKTGDLKIDVAAPGYYLLENLSFNGCKKALTVNNHLAVDSMSLVSIDSSDFVSPKDEVFRLTALNLKSTSKYKYEWTVSEGSIADPTAASVDGKLTDKDLTYRIYGTSRNVPKCHDYDSVTAYLLPEAPELAIDTNTSKTDIKLTWKAVGGADGYKVYSRKWDPYCLTEDYTYSGNVGKVYKEVYDGNQLKYIPTLDTLEFFYAKSYRDLTAVASIAKKVESAPSKDTVGYVRHIVDATASEGAIQYVFPYIFDMGNYLEGKKVQHLMYYLFKSEASSRGVWSFANQKFSMQNYVAMLKKWQPIKTDDDDDLKVGDSYQITLTKGNRKELILFGKLKDTRISFNLTGSASAGSNSIVWLPFEYADKQNYNLMTDKYWKLETPATASWCNMKAAGYWDVSKGKWTITNAISSAMAGILWNANGGPFPKDSPRILPGFHSIQFNMKDNIIWP